MELALNDEQILLRDVVARLLAERAPLDGARSVEASELGHDASLWETFAELGLLGLLVPEDLGGAGRGLLDLSLTALELGAAGYAGPYVSTVVESGLLLDTLPAGDAHRTLLREIAQGRAKLSVARYEEDVGESEAAITMPATRSDSGWTLHGRKLFVRDAEHADTLLVAARTSAGVTLFSVSRASRGIRIRRMPSLARERLAEVVFDGVRVERDAILGEEGAGHALLVEAQLKASIVKSAEMVGGMRTAVGVTVTHLLSRTQYGKPIAAFQALQHDVAEMVLHRDTSEGFLLRVASSIDHGEALDPAASMLKAYVSEAYRAVTERAVQLHGAIGTTEAHPISLFYQRSKAAETAFGSASHHYARVAAALGLGGLE